METLSYKTVKTRKHHICWGCGDEFETGSTMLRIVNVDGDGISDSYWCETCTKVMESLDYWQTEDGFSIGELRDMYREEWESYENL